VKVSVVELEAGDAEGLGVVPAAGDGVAEVPALGEGDADDLAAAEGEGEAEVAAAGVGEGDVDVESEALLTHTWPAELTVKLVGDGTRLASRVSLAVTGVDQSSERRPPVSPESGLRHQKNWSVMSLV
jgi:hypothetical protein